MASRVPISYSFEAMTSTSPTPSAHALACTDRSPRFDRVAILGAGLIGSSIAHATRLSGAAQHVVAFDANQQHAHDALMLGCVDSIAASLEEAVAQADLVVLAVPVLHTAAILQQALPSLSATALMVDVGSVKQAFVRECASLHTAVASRIVPSHPIAGHITSGPTHAHAQLMQGKLMVVTPLPVTAQAAQNRIQQFWEQLGFHVLTMTADEHDTVYANLSHMPHVLSFALMHYLQSSSLAHDRLAQLGGNAIKDMTRNAASNAKMWSDIFTANREQILTALQGFRGSLHHIERLIEQAPHADMQVILEDIRRHRPLEWERQRG